MIPASVQAQECDYVGDPVCDDGIGCTDDTCVMGMGDVGVCWHVSTCSNGDFCDGTELCCTDPGGCGGYPVGTCMAGTAIQCPPGQFCSESLDTCVYCEDNEDCDDDDPCTMDTCTGTPAGCHNTPMLGVCDDGDLCTEGDTCGGVCLDGPSAGMDCVEAGECEGGVCVPNGVCTGSEIDCDSQAPLCYDGSCVPATGNCQFIPREDGKPCNDGDLCTAVDECFSGICVGGPANGCIQMELRVSGGPYYVGDLIEVNLYAWGENCTPAPSACGGGTIQPVAGVNAALGWDPAVVELAHPDEIGEPNPEDPCDDLDSCNFDCGTPNRQYNWSSSIFPNDCNLGGDAINAPCPPPEPPPDFDDFPDNDGDALYMAYMQILCGGELADPACVAGFDWALKVTTFKFKALAPTAGVSDPTEIRIEDCVGQSRTQVASGGTSGHDIAGSLGVPVAIEVLCVDGSGCPLGVCKPDGFCLSCPTPTVVAEGPRYFAVTPAEGVEECGIYVKGVESDVECVEGWVFEDGRVFDDPITFQAPGPGGWGTTHVNGLGLMASRTYEFRADCDPSNPGTSLSEPASATLWRWADVDNDTSVSILDVTRILDGFRGVYYTLPCESDADCQSPTPVPPHYHCDLDIHKCLWITIENVDIIGAGYDQCGPEGVASILDVTVCLDAFRGFPDPCAVTWCP